MLLPLSSCNCSQTRCHLVLCLRLLDMFLENLLVGAVLHLDIKCYFSQDFVCLYLILAICKMCKLAEFVEGLTNESCLDVQSIEVFKLNLLEFFHSFFFQLLQKTVNIKLYYPDSNTWKRWGLHTKTSPYSSSCILHRQTVSAACVWKHLTAHHRESGM